MKSPKIRCVTFLFAAVTLLLQGCYHEDLSDCGVSIRFRYIKNVDQVDKFAQEVNQINLYIFDENGIFVQEMVDASSRIKEPNFAFHINLSPGKYSFVAWGNKSDAYTVTDFVSGVTKYTDAVVALKRTQNTVSAQLVDMFHGALIQSEVEVGVANQYKTIDLIHTVNQVKVIMKGLPLTRANEAPGTPFSCYVTSKNGDYRFDHTYATATEIKYLPRYTVESGIVTSDFHILRERNDGSSGSRIVVTYQPVDAPLRILVDEALSPLMIDVSKTKDLDIDNYYQIVLEFKYTNTSVTVTINGWKDIVVGEGSEGIIG